MTGQKQSKTELIFEGQFFHLGALLVLLMSVFALSDLPGFSRGEFLGLSTLVWAVLAITDSILHQLYVWFCWRMELHGKNLSRWFGDKAFVFYAILFTILLVARPILAFSLGWANRGTLNIDPLIGYGVSVLLFAPVAFLGYSIVHYFSFRRAFGIDHFDSAYRQAPLIRQGIFRWSPNAMYVFGFFALWIPAFLFQSLTALIIAAFCHAYIWVHYYATEKPDMSRIYD